MIPLWRSIPPILVGMVLLGAAMEAPACPPSPSQEFPGASAPEAPAPPEALRSGYSHLISTENNAYNPDCNPWLTADESELFYIILDGLNGPALPGFQGDWDIYVSRWDPAQGKWGPGTNLGPNINTPGPDRRPSTTATGDTLFFCRGNAIFVSMRSQGEFGPPVLLFPGSDPAITSDAQQLYFVRNADIWVADRGASIFQWTNLRSIGAPVNTAAAEVRPYLSADRTQLYFSDFGGPRAGGYGGADIWISTWTGSGWGAPANMGAPINTDRVTCTPFMNRDGSRFYTASESFEGSRGDEDIWVSFRGFTPPPREVEAPPGTWTRLGSLDGAWNVYDLAEDASGVLFAATQPEGRVFRSTDRGATWTATAPLPGAVIAYSLLAARDGNLYVGTYPEGDVFRSANAGQSWIATANLPVATAVRALLETSDGRILAGTSPICRIYATTNRGASWIQLGTPPGMTSGVSTLFESSEGHLYAGGWGRPCRSTNGGASWALQPLPERFGSHVSSIESFRETEPGRLWCTGWVHSFGGYVFRSIGGAPWDTTGRVSVGPVHAVRVYDLIDPEPGRLLIGFQPGPDRVASISHDDAATWTPEGSLPSAHEILRFLRCSDGTILAATTPNGDIFRWTPGAASAEEDAIEAATPAAPGLAAVLGATPNPFRGETAIRLQTPGSIPIDLSVVDAQGRHVRALWNGAADAGVLEVPWDGRRDDGRDAPAGIYFIRLRAESGVTFQKITRIR